MKQNNQKILMKGLDAHKKGKLNEAESSYRLILKNHPMNSDANHNLGVLLSSLSYL